MGGRGSTGGSSGGGGGIKLPELKGSEKQVSWATDILRSPYDTMEARAKSYEKQANSFDKIKKGNGENERQVASAYKSAQKRYAAEISNLPKMNPNGMKASDIIDKRSGINAIANNIIADEFKKRPALKYEIPGKV